MRVSLCETLYRYIVLELLQHGMSYEWLKRPLSIFEASFAKESLWPCLYTTDFKTVLTAR